MITYQFKIRKGIDDLKSLFAFHGASQGDETRTNSIEDYEQSKGWLNFIFDCAITKEAIAEEVERRRLWNERYVASLKSEGTYGEQITYNVNVAFNPLFDTPPIVPAFPLSSYRMLFLDIKDKKS